MGLHQDVCPTRPAPELLPTHPTLSSRPSSAEPTPNLGPPLATGILHGLVQDSLLDNLLTTLQKSWVTRVRGSVSSQGTSIHPQACIESPLAPTWGLFCPGPHPTHSWSSRFPEGWSTSLHFFLSLPRAGAPVTPP